MWSRSEVIELPLGYTLQKILYALRHCRSKRSIGSTSRKEWSGDNYVRYRFLIPNVDWSQDLSVWEWRIIDSQSLEKGPGVYAVKTP